MLCIICKFASTFSAFTKVDDQHSLLLSFNTVVLHEEWINHWFWVCIFIFWAATTGLNRTLSSWCSFFLILDVDPEETAAPLLQRCQPLDRGYPHWSSQRARDNPRALTANPEAARSSAAAVPTVHARNPWGVDPVGWATNGLQARR